MREAYQHQWSDRLKSLCGWHDHGRRMFSWRCVHPETAEKRWQRLLDTDGLRGRVRRENRPVDTLLLNYEHSSRFDRHQKDHRPGGGGCGSRREAQEAGQRLCGPVPVPRGKDACAFTSRRPRTCFHCLGCGAAGSVIDFVMRKDGLTKQPGHCLAGQDRAARSFCAARPARRPRAGQRVEPREPDALLQRVVNFYARTLHKDRGGPELFEQAQPGRRDAAGSFSSWLQQRHVAHACCPNPAKSWKA